MLAVKHFMMVCEHGCSGLPMETPNILKGESVVHIGTNIIGRNRDEAQQSEYRELVGKDGFWARWLSSVRELSIEVGILCYSCTRC